MYPSSYFGMSISKNAIDFVLKNTQHVFGAKASIVCFEKAISPSFVKPFSNSQSPWLEAKIVKIQE